MEAGLKAAEARSAAQLITISVSMFDVETEQG